MAIKFTEAAKADLYGIRSYIAQDNPLAARKVIQTIREQVNVLLDQDGIGRPGRIDGTRELVITGLPYIVCRYSGTT
ncbi:MAG: type II toxin-antitoxin system RelE/ParE family toxin [Sulfuricellaceae bacterium]|nr:type II toxin-antitoxin system RelE/ParE family toxin [Sulfuricellaceae bacterium]